jgi:hypothetical protein
VQQKHVQNINISRAIMGKLKTGHVFLEQTCPVLLFFQFCIYN